MRLAITVMLTQLIGKHSPGDLRLSFSKLLKEKFAPALSWGWGRLLLDYDSLLFPRRVRHGGPDGEDRGDYSHDENEERETELHGPPLGSASIA